MMGDDLKRSTAIFKLAMWKKNGILVDFESRPRWDKPSEWLDMDFAKIRYIKSRRLWKLYWKRASGKWEAYKPNSEYGKLHRLISTIDEDRHGCFFAGRTGVAH